MDNKKRNKEALQIISKARKNKKNVFKTLVNKGFTENEASRYCNPLRKEKRDVIVEEGSSSIKFHNDKYVYNESSDTYIIPLKCAPKPIVLKGEDHRAIIKNYSNWIGKGLTINEIARKFRMPRQYFNEYKIIFSLTHDREPLSAEEILKSDIGDSVDHILEEKRFAIHQQFEKKDWKITQEEAEKWRSFQARELEPLKLFLENYTPPTIESLENDNDINIKNSSDVFIAGLSDLHFGLSAESRYLFLGKEFNTETTSKIVDQYAYQIAEKVKSRTNGFKKAAIFCLGDILHGLRGKTEKGTQLEADKLRDSQFDYAFNTLNRYFVRMIEIFQEVEVHVVRGNHDGLDNYILFTAIAAFFRNDGRIRFHNNSCRTALVKINDVLFILDHGESDSFKHAAVPNKGKERESYIQSLLLAHPDKLIGVKQKVFIQGHLHHFENMECNDFEFIMFSSPIIGDKYSDNHNWNARPRQNCIIVGDEGISEILSFYFDKLEK